MIPAMEGPTTTPTMVVTCGSCGTKLRMRAPAQSSMGKCPKCGARLRIDPPAPAPAAAPTSAPPSDPNPEPRTPIPDPSAVEQPTTDNPPPAPFAQPARPAPPTPAHWLKTTILLLAVVVIGAAFWSALLRLTGERELTIKYALCSLLIGIATATVMLSTRRAGTPGKLVAVIAAIAAIALGQAIAVLLAPSAEPPPRDPGAWLRLLLDAHRFARTLPLVCVLAATGCAVRFILARNDEPIRESPPGDPSDLPR